MRLKELRQNRGVTQQEVANAIGCAESTYPKYERGERNIDIPTLKKLSKYFDVSIDYIVENI